MHVGVWLTSYVLLLGALMLLAFTVESLSSILRYRQALRQQTTLGENLADFSLPLASLLTAYHLSIAALPPHWHLPVFSSEWTFGIAGAFVSSVLVMGLHLELAVWFPWSSRGRRARR